RSDLFEKLLFQLVQIVHRLFLALRQRFRPVAKRFNGDSNWPQMLQPKENPRQPASAGSRTYMPVVSGALGLGDRALKLVRRCVFEVLKSRLGPSHQRSKRLRLMDGHVRQDLAVDLDARLVQAVDEAAIGQAMLAGGSIDA